MSHLPPRLLPLALLVLAACPPPELTPDAGTGLLPDLCNSLEEALTLADCELQLGQPLERYISEPNDQDWYSVRIPANAGPRTLVHVTGGYAVPSTAVNLAINLLREDGKASLARKVDNHGAGAPRPVDIVVPFGEPNARLVLLLGDQPATASRPSFDARAPYRLQVEVLENPDANEPNDTTPTALTLASQGGGVQSANATGYLATTGDVDRFSFNVAAGKVAWLKVSAPSLSPPPPFRLSYALLRPDGTRESEGRVDNNVVAVDLTTVRRIKAAGTWTLVLEAYRSPNDTQPLPGDLRLEYTVELRVMDEADPSELSGDNDLFDRAKVAALPNSPGSSSTSFTGRLAAVPDPDWYAVDVPAHSQPTVLRYRLVPLASGGRFPPLAGLVDRQVRVLTPVAGATVAEARQACYSDLTACPRGYDSRDTLTRDLVNAFCGSTTTPPLCLHATREEAPGFSALRNFEGTLPVPPHTSTLRYYFLVQDDGNNWADDKDYRLEVEWLADADEAARYSGGTEQPTPRALAEDPAASNYPAPPAGAAYEVGGVLSHGHGRAISEDRGVRGPDDYDAVLSDVDTFNFQLPSGLSEPLDRSWELQWEVQHLPDGGLPAHLALELTFCDGDRLDGGTCTPVRTTTEGSPLILSYTSDKLASWQTPPNTFSGFQELYSRTQGAGSTTVTLTRYACPCLEARFVRGGSFSVAVSAVDRRDHAPVSYTLRTAYTDYPKSYTEADAGTALCPPPVQDGGGWAPGCAFTQQN